MTPQEFKKRLDKIAAKYPDFAAQIAPLIAGRIAVSVFKRNFQTESFNGVKWLEVQRRTEGTKAYKAAERRHPARNSRKILTGDTADLGRSIEVKEAASGRAVVWTSPRAFSGREPYGQVHNDGLRAGRGSGFIMPRRQFMGHTEELNDQVVKALEQQMAKIFK